MKGILKNTLINGLSLFLLTQLITGIAIEGGFVAYVLAGFCLTLLFTILRPILNLISLPLNALTLGFFSVFTNGILFYLLTVFIPSVSIKAFTFPGASFAGFIIPKISINTFFAFLVVAFLQSIIFTLIKWIIRK
jgi:putative membrane protein